MSEELRPESGWRGSREVWLDAAHALLIESGVESVTIQSLSKRLKIARTSFYWHFSDRPTLLSALADRWAARTSQGMIAACKAFDSRLEFALRAWAQSDPAIMERLHQEDRSRLEALILLFHRWGHAGVDAETRARTVYLTQIGYISMQVRETVETRLARVPSYVQIYTGTMPDAREIARFKAQHRPPA